VTPYRETGHIMRDINTIIISYVGYNASAIKGPHGAPHQAYEDGYLQVYIFVSIYRPILQRELHRMNIEFDDRLLAKFKVWYCDPDKNIVSPQLYQGHRNTLTEAVRVFLNGLPKKIIW
jgi:hypothetical protein